MTAHAYASDYVTDIVLRLDAGHTDNAHAVHVAETFAGYWSRIRHGDAAAFDTLVLAISPQLDAYARRLTGSPDAAFDLVQDVLVHLWTHRETLHIQGSIRGYLYAALRNRALDVHKQRRAEGRRLDIHEDDHIPGMAPALPPTDALVTRAEIAARVTAALSALAPRARETALLRWLDELSRDEIASVMGVTVRTVNTQLTIAARAMRALLSDLREQQ